MSSPGSPPPRPFRRFIGVDLGGGKGKNTAMAVLERTSDGAQVVALAPRPSDQPLYDDVLLERLRAESEHGLLAIDAPLTLPPCLRCTEPVCPGAEACRDPAVITMRRIAPPPAPVSRTAGRDGRRGKPAITPYTQRATEVFLQVRSGTTPRETLGQGMGPLTARASHLLRGLADRYRLNDNLIEVYPKATLVALGFRERYKRHLHERNTRASILAALAPSLTFGPGIWRESCVQSDHVFDAVIAAYTAFLYARDGWTLPEEHRDVVAQDGWIWTPPFPDRSGENADEDAQAVGE